MYKRLLSGCLETLLSISSLWTLRKTLKSVLAQLENYMFYVPCSGMHQLAFMGI